MTDYRQLSDEDQIDIQEAMDGNDLSEEDKEEVMSGHRCADCYMLWYQCTCSHDDLEDE